MQINKLTGNTNVENLKSKNGEITTGSGEFQAMLEKLVAGGETELPTVWSSNKFGNGAVENVVKFLSEKCGVNAYERVPTYELTNSELDWIKSRHDETQIKNLQPFTSDEGDLLADLVFRNVISPEDAKTLQGTLIPAFDFASLDLTEQGGFLSRLFPEGVEASYLERLDMVQGTMEKLIGYYSEKQDTASNSEAAAYVQNAKAFSENKQTIKDLLAEIVNSY